MADTVRLATQAMGTRFEAIILGRDAVHARTAGEAAMREIEHWHAALSLFDRASFLSHINATAHRHAVTLEPDLFALLRLCARVWTASGGAFDPTIAPRMRELGLHDRADDRARRTGLDAIVLDEPSRSVRFSRPGIALDLGGIAKGFALDRAAEVLRDAGVSSAFIHGGTSSGIAIGDPSPESGQTHWTVALGPSPSDPHLPLRDAAFSVSAPSGRVVGGVHHILDPRAGGDRIVPVDRAAAAWASVSDDPRGSMTAAECDAWSTALVVIGRRPPSMPPVLSSAVRSGDQWIADHTSLQEVELARPRTGAA